MRTDDWLRQLPPPDPDAPERIWERLEASRQRPAAPWQPLALASGATLIAAAAAVLATRAAPRIEPLEAIETQHVAWSADVRLDYQGRGVAEGSEQDLSVQWDDGILRAEVAPERGNRVEVRTKEAVVTVVGTVFAVERGPLGTTTWVDRGEVHVACTDGSEHTVTADTASATCLPTRPGALLGRADALLARDAEPEMVLDTLARGLAVAEPGSPTEGELLARRLEQEARQGELGKVLATGSAYVEAGHTLRIAAIAASATRMAAAAGRCADAAQWLERTSDPLLDDRLALARCWTDAGADTKAIELLRAAEDAGHALPEPWLDWLRATEAP